MHIFLHFGTFWNIFWQKIDQFAHFLAKNRPICTFFGKKSTKLHIFWQKIDKIAHFFTFLNIFWQKIDQFAHFLAKNVQNCTFFNIFEHFLAKNRPICTFFYIFEHFGTFLNIFWQKIDKIANFLTFFGKKSMSFQLWQDIYINFEHFLQKVDEFLALTRHFHPFWQKVDEFLVFFVKSRWVFRFFCEKSMSFWVF